MAHSDNLATYLAERLVFYDHISTPPNRKRTISEAIPGALSEGKVILSGLEFSLRNVGLNFIIRISPVQKKEIPKFKEHVHRLEDPEFWKEDSYMRGLKKAIQECSYFVENEKSNLNEKGEFVISGKFFNNNRENCYRAVLNKWVKPFRLYGNFP